MLVPVLVLGAGCQCCELPVHLVETGCRVLSAGVYRCWALVLGAGVVVLGAAAVSWLSARLRRAAALVGRWRRCRCCQLAKRAGAGVS